MNAVKFSGRWLNISHTYQKDWAVSILSGRECRKDLLDSIVCETLSKPVIYFDYLFFDARKHKNVITDANFEYESQKNKDLLRFCNAVITDGDCVVIKK